MSPPVQGCSCHALASIISRVLPGIQTFFSIPSTRAHFHPASTHARQQSHRFYMKRMREQIDGLNKGELIAVCRQGGDVPGEGRRVTGDVEYLLCAESR